MPEVIANAPELLEGLAFFYRAFWDVNTCRQLGFGAEGPIPWTAIRQWAEEHELQGDQREDLFFYVGEMDGAYLKYATDKAKRERQRRETEARSKANRPTRRR